MLLSGLYMPLLCFLVVLNLVSVLNKILHNYYIQVYIECSSTIKTKVFFIVSSNNYTIG